MKKNTTYISIIITILILSIILNLFFIINNGKRDNITDKNNISIIGNEDTIKDPINNIINTDNISTGIIEKVSTGILIKDNKISLDEALKIDAEFSNNLGSIKNKFNYVQVLIKQFNAVNNIEDFNKFEKKFGNQTIMYTALKMLDDKLIHKYNTLSCTSNKCNITEEDFSKLENDIFSSIRKDGYYNLENMNTNTDYMYIALSSKNIKDKNSLCEKLFTKDEDNASCKKFSLYISANNENKYCDSFEQAMDKKWCKDTLLLLN